MIKKLRRKIFWSIEFSALGVLLVILIFVNVSGALHNEHENWEMMNMFLQTVEGRDADEREHGKAAGAVRAMMDSELCAVELDSVGDVVSVTGNSVIEDSGELESIIEEIVERGQTQGSIGSIRYILSGSGAGRLIVLSDYGLVGNETAQTLLISLGGLLAAGLLFGLLAFSLSKRIVRPVEETLREQKRFIADASHELKTPVTVINANIAVLEKENGTNKWMTFIREEGERLSALVSSMLEYARVDCARELSCQTQPPVRFDAAAAATEAALPFESVAFEAGISCEFDIPEHASAYGSAEELKQMIGILLDNAIKHTEPHGSVALRAENAKKRKKLREENIFVLSVSNTGEEIPAEALPLLFRRFYRVDPSRQHRDNSFGLGLAIAQALAEKNNGEITVTSRDRLTVFTLELPAR